jgi:Prenylcysteine lyase
MRGLTVQERVYLFPQIGFLSKLLPILVYRPANRVMLTTVAMVILECNSRKGLELILLRWDGTQFVYTQSAKSNSLWNIIKLVRRYGWSPVKVSYISFGVPIDVKSWNLASTASKTFDKLYDEPIYPFTDLTNVSNALGLTDITKLPANVSRIISLADSQEYLKQKGVSDLFAHDFIQAATRVFSPTSHLGADIRLTMHKI